MWRQRTVVDELVHAIGLVREAFSEKLYCQCLRVIGDGQAEGRCKKFGISIAEAELRFGVPGLESQ